MIITKQPKHQDHFEKALEYKGRADAYRQAVFALMLVVVVLSIVNLFIFESTCLALVTWLLVALEVASLGMVSLSLRKATEEIDKAGALIEAELERMMKEAEL